MSSFIDWGCVHLNPLDETMVPCSESVYKKWVQLSLLSLVSIFQTQTYYMVQLKCICRTTHVITCNHWWVIEWEAISQDYAILIRWEAEINHQWKLNQTQVKLIKFNMMNRLHGKILFHRDAMMSFYSWSTLAKVMSCCLRAGTK